MRRPVTPAASARSGYPRLRAGWRVLLGTVPLCAAAPARADVTLPARPGTGAAAAATRKPAPCPNTLNGDAKPATPGPAPRRDHRTGGVMLRPSVPIAPTLPSKVSKPKEKAKDSEKTGDGDGWRVSGFQLHVERVIHPHGPDEPCKA